MSVLMRVCVAYRVWTSCTRNERGLDHRLMILLFRGSPTSHQPPSISPSNLKTPVVKVPFDCERDGGTSSSSSSGRSERSAQPQAPVTPFISSSYFTCEVVHDVAACKGDKATI